MSTDTTTRKERIMLLEMKVFGLAMDPYTNAPVVILKDAEEKNVLPVWIGALEASAIASELEHVHFSRPMTHDLIKDILRNVSALVTRIEVIDLKDNVFYATIHMATQNGTLRVDARPSDAIAIALRTSSPIFVDMDVLEKSKRVDMRGGTASKGETAPDAAKELDKLGPEDFGKYKM